jgi:riboflavin kinase / FMN adenylyltransferase
MQIFRSLGEIPADFGPSIVTVGNFDGVHCAHRAVLAQLVKSARAQNAKAVAVTFTPHPTRVLRPEKAPLLLTPDDVKLELLAESGLDAVLVLPFTEELRQTSAEEFAQRVLVGALHATEVHEGESFHFGYRGAGSVVSLQELGAKYGFRVQVFAPLLYRGAPISSSRIRACIADGNLRDARHLLGRNYSVRSTPAPGRGYGTRYAVPTINLAPYAEMLPAHGVYVTTLRVGEETFQSVTNVGNRPTFGADSFAVESHILDFHPLELSENTPLELTFFDRLRGEQKFASPELLKAQILRDVARAQRYLHLRAALDQEKN